MSRACTAALSLGALSLTLTACGGVARVLRPDAGPSPAPLAEAVQPASTPTAPPALDPASAVPADSRPTLAPPASAPDVAPVVTREDAILEAAGSTPGADGVLPSAESVPARPPIIVAQAPPAPRPDFYDNDLEPAQYDPWEPFNETMFEFNRSLDRYVLKPVARVYKVVMPEEIQVAISNGFDNIRWVPRFVNSLLQGKFEGAGREVARFLINSTAGVGGLFDPAKDHWGIRKSREDFGQTLGVWGSGPGPYLILPFMEPMTVRDGVGRGVDLFLDPLGYFVPLLWTRFGMKVGDTVNERAVNYDLFEGVEETTIDLYSSVRHFYLNRRERLIRE